MAPVLDATIAGATSNAYLDVAAASLYFDNRLHVDAWTNASADDKARALISATSRLDVEAFLGERATTTQRLQWPKQFPLYSTRRYPYLDAEEVARVFTATAIPREVQEATCEMALAILNATGDLAAVDALSKFASISVPGTISLTLRETGLPSNDALPPVVLRLLGDWFDADDGVTRLVRA